MLKDNKKPTISFLARIGYALAAFSLGATTFAFLSMLFLYAHFTARLAYFAIGICVFVAAVLIILTIPALRYFSDRVETLLLGKRWLFFLPSFFAVAIFFVSLFLTEDFGASMLTLALSLVGLFMGYVGMLLPYYALDYELSGDKRERNEIRRLKEGCMLLGCVAALALCFVLQPQELFGQFTQNLAFVMGGTVLVCGMLSFLSVYHQLPRQKAKEKQQESEPQKTLKQVYVEFLQVYATRKTKWLAFFLCECAFLGAIICLATLHSFLHPYEVLTMLVIFVLAFTLMHVILLCFNKISHKTQQILGFALAQCGLIVSIIVLILQHTAPQNILFFLPAPFLQGLGFSALLMRYRAQFMQKNQQEYFKRRREYAFLLSARFAALAISALLCGIFFSIFDFSLLALCISCLTPLAGLLVASFIIEVKSHAKV